MINKNWRCANEQYLTRTNYGNSGDKPLQSLMSFNKKTEHDYTIDNHPNLDILIIPGPPLRASCPIYY
ncbi:hypothetical protein [Lysinibacillus pakistanensis]|uniref:hypothetical protein n=1 Tax=Lysinibacillus pakistanensis TaxID=759811 RepID=UPI0028AB32CB|nr:hypothetical protein [Lysinibacillus pakistanensis]